MTTDSSPLHDRTELEVSLKDVDIKTRLFIKDLLDYKAQIEERLQDDTIGVKEESDLKEALKMIADALHKIRFVGFYQEWANS